jgi:hypothetical protein
MDPNLLHPENLSTMRNSRDKQAEMWGRMLFYVILAAVGFVLVKGIAFLYRTYGPWKATVILAVLIVSGAIGYNILASNSERSSAHQAETSLASQTSPTLGETTNEQDRQMLESQPVAANDSPEVRAAIPMQPAASATPQTQTYRVVGLSPDDALNVRSGPGVSNPIIARLPD